MPSGTEWSSHHSFELDKQRRLHLHAIAVTSKVPHYKSFQKKGMIIHFEKKPYTHKRYIRAVNYVRKYQGDNPEVSNEYQTISYLHFNNILRKTL